MKLNVGDSVKLITTKYGTNLHNPVHLTEYSCEGIIENIIPTYRKNIIPEYENDLLPIRVLWNNGYSNNYSENDLNTCSSIKNYKSIW